MNRGVVPKGRNLQDRALAPKMKRHSHSQHKIQQIIRALLMLPQKNENGSSLQELSLNDEKLLMRT